MKIPSLTKMIAAFLFVILFGLSTSREALAEPTTGTLPHKTDFLTFPACKAKGCGTTWYAAKATAAERTTYRSDIIRRNYTHAYLSVTSSTAGHLYYPSQDPNGPAKFKALLQELVDSGIKPVVWLTSDSGNWRNQSIDVIKNDLSNFIPVIDSLVNSYVLALEVDEYWTLDKSNQIGAHLDNLTSKPLADHQLPGKWDYCTSWCDYMILQYGFGKTADGIKTMTGNAINSLSPKPVVAGEYNTDENNEALSITLGNAALTRCAAGFGNGATPSNIIYPGCSSINTPTPTARTTPTPTSAINQPPVAQNTSVTTTLNTQVYVQLTFIDPDGPGPYTYTITQQPTNGNLTGSDNDRTYTPNSGFTGTDTFRWKVRDGLADSNIATVTINVAVKAGDANGDGLVNIADYAIWLTNYNKNLSGPTYGDFNSNGKVDGIDFVIWLKNYTG